MHLASRLFAFAFRARLRRIRLRLRARPAQALLAAILALPAAPLFAQTTLFFNNGENFGTDSSTTVASPLTVNITSGVAAHNGVIFGDGSLTKTGDGTITLTQANTYTGTTNVSDGTLTLTSTTASAEFALAAGATLELNVAAGTRDYAATTFTGSGTLAKIGDGTVTWGVGAATFALGSGALIDVQAGTFFGGSSANENWTANLADLHVASGATFSGVEANVRADALTGSGTITSGFNGAGYTAFTFGVDGGSGTYSGVLADTDTGGGHLGHFTKAGSGTQILTGANTYTGVTTIDGGTLQLGDGVTNGSLASASIVNHGTFVLNRTDDYTFNSVVSGTGGLIHDGFVLRLANPQTYTGPTAVRSGGYLVLPGNADQGLSAATTVDLEAGAFFDISNRPQTIAGLSGAGSLYSFISGADAPAGHLTINTAAGQTFDFSGNLGHTVPQFGLTKTGLGTQILSGPNTYTGATTVSAGTLTVAHATALGTTAAGTSVAYGATLGLTNNITVAEAIANEGTVTNPSGANTLSGVLSGPGNLDVSGGTLTLIAANPHSGTTTVSGGALALGHADALQNSTANLTGGSLDFGTLTAANLGGLSGSQNLALTNSAAEPAPIALSVGANHDSTSYSGNLFGPGSLTKVGDGTLTLSGANTYTGATTVSVGTLTLASDTALGTTAAGTTVASGATLTLTNDTTVAEAIASDGTLTNDSDANTLSGVLSGSGNLEVSGGSLTLTAANTFTGPTTLNGGNLIIGHSDALQFSTLHWSSSNVDWGSLTAVSLGGLTGNDSMALVNDSAQPVTLTVGANGEDTTFSGYFTATAGSVVKTGTGTLYLDNISYHSGSTTIEGGTLRISYDSALGVAAGNTLILDGGTLQTTDTNLPLSSDRAITLATGGGTFDGSFTYNGAITGPGGLTKVGPDTTLILGGANTFSGPTDVVAGTLEINHAQALQNSTLVLDGSGFVLIDSSIETLHLGGLSGSANITELYLDPEEGPSGPGLYELSGNLSIGANNESTTYSGAIDGNSRSLTKVGTGTLTLSGASTYSGTTSILGGTLSISAANNLGETSPYYHFLILDGGTLRTTADLTFTSDSVVEIGTAHGTIETATGTTLTFDSILDDSGNLTKTGAGSLHLGANSYGLDGVLTVAAGTVRIAESSSLESAEVQLTGGTVIFGASIGNATFDGLGGSANLLLADENADAVALTVGYTSGRDTDYSGVLSGPGSLQLNAGTLQLSNENTFTGEVSVSAGKLVLGHTHALATQAITVDDQLAFADVTSATLAQLAGFGSVSLQNDANAPVTLTVGSNNASTSFSGVISGPGALTKTGAGSLTLSGTNTYTGATTVSGGTLQLSSDGALGSTTSVDVASGATLDLNGHSVSIADLDGAGNIALGSANLTTGDSASHTLSGIVSGTGSLTKTGSGTLTLTGANTYSGGTTISAGTLTGTSTSLQGDITNNAALVFDQASDGTYAGIASGSGTLTKSGSGNLTLSGANTYTGGTTIEAGTLQGNTTSLTGNITNNATVTFEQSLPGTYAGVISGTGAFIKSGPDTLTLASAQTYTGATTIEAGTLRFGGANRLPTSTSVTIADGATLDLNGFSAQLAGLQGAGDVNLGANTLTLSTSLDQEFSGNLLAPGNLYMFGTGTLTLSGDNNGLGILVISGATIRLGSDTALQSGTTVDLSLGGTLDVNDQAATAVFTPGDGGHIDLGSGSGSLTIVGNGGTLLHQVSGGGTLIKTGADALTLSAANTYTGTTAITEGTLHANHATALGTSTVEINSGAALQLDTALTVGGLRGGGMVNAFGHSFTVDNTGDDLFSGNIVSDFGFMPSGTFIKTGSGTLTLSGNNSELGGQVQVNGGTLGLAHSSALGSFSPATVTIASGATLALSNNISISATVANAGTLQNLSGHNAYGGTLTGAGTLAVEDGQLALIGQSSGFTGAVAIHGGTLLLGSADALTAPSAITIASGGTLDLNGQSRTYAALDGAGHLALGSATLTTGDSDNHSLSGLISGSGALAKIGSGTLTLSGANTYGGGTTITNGTVSISADSNLGATNSTLTLDGGTLLATSALTLDAARTIQLGTSGGTLAADSTLTVASQISGTGNLGLGGEGTITLANFNSFTGTTTLLDGDLTVNVAHQYALQGSVVAPRGGLRFSGIQSATFGGLNGADSEFDYLHLENTDSEAVALTLNVGFNPMSDTDQRSVISGSGSLIIAGSGTQTLSAANTFTGTTTLNSGTLALAHSLALQGSTVVPGGGQLFYDGIDTATFGGLAGSGALSLPTTSLSVGANHADTTFSGSLNGSGLLIKVGTGNLTFASFSPSTFDLRLDAGTFSPGFSSTLQSANVELNGGALGFGNLTSASVGSLAGSGNLALANASDEPVALFIAGSSDKTYSGQLSGPGSLTVALSGGNLTLSAANTFTGSTTLNSGTLTLAHALALQNSTLNLGFGSLSFDNLAAVTLGGLAGSGSLQLPSTSLTVGGNHADTTFSGSINGSGLLIKTGTGNLTFAPMFSGSHDIRLDAGTFTLGNSSVLAQSKLELNGGALGFGNLTSAFVGGLAGSGDLALANDSAAPVALFVGGSGDTTYSGQLSGPGSLTKTVFGTFTLTGAHTFTGATTIDNGELVLASTASLAGPVILSSGTLTLATATGLAASTVHLNGGTLSYDNLATATLGGLAGSGALSLPTTSLSVGANDADTTFSGYVNNSGLLIKVGAGNLTFAPSFSTDHGVRLDAGTFTLGAISTLEQSAVELNGGTLGFGQLTEARLGRLSGSGDLTLLNTADTPAAVALLVGSAGGDTTYAGSLSGPGSLTKTGFGTLTLTGAHTFTGATTLSDGNLVLGASASLAGDFILSSGTFTLANATGLAASTVHLDGGTLSYDNVATVTFGGLAGSNNLTLPTTSLIVGGNDQDTAYSGYISNQGTLIKVGVGTLTFDGQFDDSASLRLDAGTFALGTSAVLERASVHLNGGTLDFGQRTTATLNALNGTGSLALLNSAETPAAVALTLGYNGAASTYSGVLSGPGSLELVGGSLTLSGAHTFTGQTTLESGNLTLTATGSLAGDVNVNGGTFTLANATGLATSTVTLNNGDIIFDGLADVTFGGLAGSSSLSLPVNSLTIGSNNQNTTYSGSLSGSGVVIKTGTGDFAFNASYPDTNHFRLDTGTLSISESNILQDSIVQLNGGTLGFGNLTEVSVGRLTGTGDLALQNSAETPVAVALTVGNRSEATTYAGVLSGPGSLTKTGIGTVTLSGANTFTGDTLIESGTLQLDATLALQHSTVRLQNGALAFGASTETATIGGLAGEQGSSLLLENASYEAVQLTVGGNHANTEFAGVLSGSGSLAKTGSGTLTLSGTNTHDGGISVNAGTVAITDGEQLGTGAIHITNGGQLTASAVTVWSQDLTVDGTGSRFVTPTGAGGLIDAPIEAYSGGLSSALTVTNGGAIEAGFLGFSGNGTDAATLNVTAGGTLTTHQSLAIGYNNSAEITLNVTGPGSIVHVGDRNAPSGNGLVIGSYNPSAPALVSVSAGGRIDAEAVAIGFALVPFEDNRGQLDINAGGTVETLIVQLGTVADDQAILNLNTGGTLQIHGGAESLNAEPTAGAINLNGGTLTVSTSAFSTTANATLGTGTTSTLHTDGVDATWSGVLSGSGSLTKTGSGTLTLSGANTFTGSLTISAGSLALGDGGTLGATPGIQLGTTASPGTLDLTASTSGFVFGPAQSLTGTGTVNLAPGQALSLAGTFAPGNSPGLVTVDGDLLLTGTSVTLMELGGLARGTTYDAVDVSGALSLGGTLTVTLLNDFAPAQGDSFQLFSFTSFGGSFAQVNLPTIAPGLAWDTSRLLDEGTLEVSAIPEPSAFAALAGLATLALATTRRRRRA